MKIRINSCYSVQFFSFCILLFLLSIKILFAQDIQMYNLKIDFSFPSETDKILLGRPTAMSFDKSNNIYICDYQMSTIFKYTNNGTFIRKIGQSGKGPGEFTNQSKFAYFNGKIFIIDQSNIRIQILNKDGEYEKSFMTRKIPSAIAVHDSLIFLVFNSRIDPLKTKFFTVFDYHGKKVNEFGEFLKFKVNFPPIGSNCKLKIFHDKIYVMYRYYPIIRVYSLAGELLTQLELKGINYKKLVPMNYDWSKFGKKNQMAFPFRYLFNAFDVNEEGIWIGLYNADILIDHYDLSGSYIERYVLKHKQDKFYLFDLKVTNIKKRKFYILNRELYPKLDICSVDNN